MNGGTKTSEFWIVLGTLIMGFAMGFYALYKGPDYLLGAAAIIGALAPHTVGYAISRAQVKKNV